MTSPIVSIITPSFNRAHIIFETAESIFKQNYPNWEWIIVDDGSTDSSWSLLQKYASEDSRVKIFQRNREPKGACTCRNIAVKKSLGEFLIFLDTDDLLAPFCLNQRIEAFKITPDCDFIIFPMLLFKKEIDDMKILWNVDSNEDDIKRILKGDPVCQGTGTLWKKKSFIQIGMWNEDLLLWQDIELHLRALISGLTYSKRFDLIPDTYIRVTENSLSRSGYNSLNKYNSRISVLYSSYHQMIEKGIFNLYLLEIKNLFLDLYVSGSRNRYFQQVDDLIKFQKTLEFFTKNDLKNLKYYTLLYKYRLNHLKYLRYILEKKISKMTQIEKKTTLCQIPYIHSIGN